MAFKQYIIGIVGHRELLEKDWKVELNKEKEAVIAGDLINFIKTKLSDLNEKHSKRIVLLSGMAEGADLLVCSVAHQLGIPFKAILPFEQKNYSEHFQSEAQKILFGQLIYKAEEIIICKPEKNMNPFAYVGKYIAKNSNEMIALWNGIDTGKEGGTWDVVKMAMLGKDANQKKVKFINDAKREDFVLHQLLTPRISNPFPIAKNFNAQSINLSLGTPYTWNIVKPFSIKEESFLSKLWSHFVEYRSGILKYGITFLLFMISIIFSTWGIIDYVDNSNSAPKENHFWDSLFKAIKMSGLVLPDFDKQVSKVSKLYIIGKFSGLIFFCYVTSIAVLMLMGDTFRRFTVRIFIGKFWDIIKWGALITLIMIFSYYQYQNLISKSAIGNIKKWLPLLGMFFILLFHIKKGWFSNILTYLKLKKLYHFGSIPFNLILGLNEKSSQTLTELRKNKEITIAMEPQHESKFFEESQQKGAIVIGDDPSVKIKLKDIGFHHAKNIFSFGEDDNTNIHLAQQLERLLVERGNENIKSDWYFQVKNAEKRQFLTKYLAKMPNVDIHSFNLNENISRQLLNQYPIDKFTDGSKISQLKIAIFGFEELGQQILISCLKIGHFQKNRDIEFFIFATEAEKKEKEFYSNYPFLSKQEVNTTIFSDGIGKELVTDVFGHVSINFYEEPKNDFELLREDFAFYNLINSENILSVYFTYIDELITVSRLSLLLERLNNLQNEQKNKNQFCDLQLFYYYNFPDLEESNSVEKKLNSIAEHIPVVAFGNDIIECSATRLRKRYLDNLPQLIALYYNEVLDKNLVWLIKDAKEIKIRAKDNWKNLTEYDKESNRIFADHIYIKLRFVWNKLELNQQQSTLDVSDDLLLWLDESPENVDELSKIENRRWCAEKMLDGWSPLITDVTKLKELTKLWKNDNQFKKLARSQKRHLDLVPVKYLDEIEFKKDIRLIQGIPLFLKILTK